MVGVRVRVRVTVSLGIGLGLGFHSGQSQCVPPFRSVNYHILVKSGTRRSRSVPPFRKLYTNPPKLRIRMYTVSKNNHAILILGTNLTATVD